MVQTKSLKRKQNKEKTSKEIEKANGIVRGLYE